MVPGPPSYIFGTYTMCAYYNTQFRCTITEGVKECSTEQIDVSVPGSPYTRPGAAFTTISSPPSANGTATAANVPGLEMRRFIPPYAVPNTTKIVNSETGYIGQLEANPFQTSDSQIKVRFEQVYLNQTGIGYKDLSGTDFYLDCTFPNEDQSADAGWDMVCIGNFDDTILQSGSPSNTLVRAMQQLFYVKGDDSAACDGVPEFPVAAL
jgi:hypothetical protein